MLTTKECIDLCKSKFITDVEMLKVIEKFIYDKKQVIVKINIPRDIINIELMNIAFLSASNFYLKNFD